MWEETRRRMIANHVTQTPLEPPKERSPQPWNKLVREQWRQLVKSGSLPIRWVRQSNMSLSLSRTPIEPSIAYVVAQRLILRHWLLVFDEIQLLDVSSATLLADVLSWFWRMGGVIIGSSNKVPDDLYKNGVQRERLEPFVEALKARCPVILMRSEHDWRAVRSSHGERSWYTFAQRRKFEDRVAQIDRAEGSSGEIFGSSDRIRTDSRRDPAASSPADITVFGRTIHVPWSVNGCCWFTFAELCGQVRHSIPHVLTRMHR